MIEFREATKVYGKSDHPALDRLTLTVPDGSVFGFLGPNGAGKTTAIRLLTGVLRPTAGTVLVNGVDVTRDPVAVKKMIGFVPDSQEMYERLTGMEYLHFMADIFGVSTEERKQRIDHYLEMFELTDAASDRIQGYSRGMKQKISVIGALIHCPPVFVLDEPMVGLDPKASFLLKEEMRAQAKAGVTVFFSTHVLEVAEKLCDQVGIIHHGQLLTQGTPEALRNQTGDTTLEQVFLDLTQAGEAEES